MIAFLFKIGAAPFHGPTTDLYQNQKTWITTWLMIVPKTGLLIVLSNIIQPFSMIGVGSNTNNVLHAFTIIAIISLIIGSVGLGSQFLIKRFIAFSSISHIGYLLLSLVSNFGISGFNSLHANIFYTYLIVYSLTVFVLFSTISLCETLIGRSLNQISDISGLFRMNPA